MGKGVGKKREKEDCSNQNCISNPFNQFILELTSSDYAKSEFIWINPSYFCLMIFQTRYSRCPTH